MNQPRQLIPQPSFARAVLAVYWLSLAVGSHWPNLHFGLPDAQIIRIHYDKLLHVFAFAGLGVLLTLARPLGRAASPVPTALVAALIGSIYAVIDEYTQQWFGRHFNIVDLVSSLVGILAVSGAALVFGLLPQSGAGSDPTPDDGAEPFVGHAALVGALTLLSRVTGLVRDAVLAAVFGLSGVLDAFQIGFLVPNLFRRLFGEGALVAAFIPHYAELIKQDPVLARRFASLCIAVLIVVLGAVTVTGELILAWLLGRGGWDADAALAIRLAMIMLPYMPMICLVALLGGMLQVHRKFGPPAAVPIVLNLTMIVFATWGFWDSAPMPNVAAKIAAGVLVAGVLQLPWQLGALLRCTAFTAAFGRTGAAFRSMLVTMIPMLIGLGVFQINTFLDGLIAFSLSGKNVVGVTPNVLGLRLPYYPIDVGGFGGLLFSQRLYQFPLGVFGIAIATAIFPALARASSGRDQREFGRILRQGLRLTVFVGLPASAGLVIARLPLARVMYERGKFTFLDAQQVAEILTGYAVSVWAYSMVHVLTRAFYAYKDSVTPLRISVSMVGLNLMLNLTLIWPLGIAGLAWSTAICAVIQFGLLSLRIRRHVPTPIDRAVLAGWGRTAVVTAIMAAVLAPVVWLFDPAELSRGAAAVELAVLVVVGAAVYTLGAHLAGCDELAWLRRGGSFSGRSTSDR